MNAFTVEAGAGVALGPMFKSGGEARIHELLGISALVAKMYHKLSAADEERIRRLIAVGDDALRRPTDPYVAFTWPAAAIVDGAGATRGVLLPRLAPALRPLRHWLVPGRLDAWRNAAMAYGIAELYARLEANDVVYTDTSLENGFADAKGRTAMCDCDSALPPGPRPRSTPKTTPGFAAPETLVDPSCHDVFTMRFGLAVLLTQLLSLGAHPFAGRPHDLPRDELEDWGFDAAVRRGATRFDPTQQILVPGGVLPPSVMPGSLAELAHAALVVGRAAECRTQRPSAALWRDRLATHVMGLRRCDVAGSHAYDPAEHRACPWCAAGAARGAVTPRRRWTSTRAWRRAS